MHEVINPATEQVIAQVPSNIVESTDEAIAKAHQVFAAWRDVAPGDRANLLRRFSDVVRDHVEELALLEVANSGHTIGNARWEANNVANVLAYYAGSPERLFGKQIPVQGGIDITFKEPIGVVGIIVPWNFPMPIASWGFAPALAAGCTVVLKPAELTPLTAIRLGELALVAGIPEGVFTVIPGDGPVVGERFVSHPLVRKVVFTGSSAVGEQIMAGAAKNMKRVTLELGGKSANVIFADSDLEKAAAAAPYAVFDNSGQDCCARSRILVQENAYDRFMELFESAVKNVVVGDPNLESTEMGPLISRRQLDAVKSFVPEDAPIAFQGSCPTGPGFWFPPTVLAPVTSKDRTFQQEIFGPVVVVSTFTDEAEAITMANDSDYGLSGSIWTQNLGKAIRVSRAIEAGNLSVNSHSSVRYWTPFGGYKKSGIGRELGPDALDAFTEVKNIFISTDN
jgi:acyl-CoA reductase-like NAD-dependent aldehyde dehydrogenase